MTAVATKSVGEGLLKRPEKEEIQLPAVTPIDFAALALKVAEGKGSRFENFLLSSREELRELAGFISKETSGKLAQLSVYVGALRDNLTELSTEFTSSAPRAARRLSTPEGVDSVMCAMLALGERGISPEALMIAIKQKPTRVCEVLEIGGLVAREILEEIPVAAEDLLARVGKFRGEVEKAVAEHHPAPKKCPSTRRLRKDAEISDIEFEAIRVAADPASTSIYQDTLITQAVKALSALRKNPEFQFTPKEVKTLLDGDKDGIHYLIRLGDIELRQIKGTPAAFAAALRTVQEKGSAQTDRLGGALMGHMRELEVAQRLIELGYTIEGISQKILNREIDVVAAKGGCRYLVEVKNSEEAFLKGAQKREGIQQLAGQLYTAHKTGDRLLVVIAEGKKAQRVNEIIAYAERSLKVAQDLLAKDSSLKGEVLPPQFLYTNQYLRKDGAKA